MYVPKYYKVSDLEEIKEFIQHNSFATIVSIRKGKPIAAHIPVLLKKSRMTII